MRRRNRKRLEGYEVLIIRNGDKIRNRHTSEEFVIENFKTKGLLRNDGSWFPEFDLRVTHGTHITKKDVTEWSGFLIDVDWEILTP